MAAHLAPLSRRDFIRHALIFSAALGVSPELLAASRRTDKDTWALFSDIHISGDPAKIVRGTNPTENFKLAAAEVLKLSRNPAALMICGDLAFSQGLSEDYRNLVSLLDPLRAAGLPLHLALGNHDNRERFWAAFPKARKSYLKDKHALILKTPHANVFLLDSLERTNSTPGLLGEEQLFWLAKQLDSQKRKPAIVVAHHNPMDEPNTGALKDTQALFDVLRPRKQVKAYVFGHTHQWHIAEDTSGIHLVNLPALAHVFGEESPSGWVLATFKKQGMSLELRCVNRAHKLHGQKVELNWRT